MTLEKSGRILSIDLLRGIIMVIMAIDHCRDFLHFDAWVHNPLDFQFTTPPLFLTRWITNYCAPNFIFLTGLSAYLYGLKRPDKLTGFLITRGLFLVLLEITLFRYLWFDDLPLTFTHGGININFAAMVIWAIGLSMVFLAVWHKLPYIIVLITGLLIVFLHNFADSYHPGNSTVWGGIWGLIHVQGPVTFGLMHIYVLYPILPYLGLILLGYCLGKLYTPDFTAKSRKRILVLLGTGCIVLFIALRAFNIYGDDPHTTPWTHYTNLWSSTADYVFSILSFINTTKYPCSLLFILMTVGPALIFLAIAENAENAITRFFSVFGRVPMFYYILHLILIKLIMVLLQALNHYDTPRNHYHLTTVYFAWMFVVFVLYFPCSWFAKYKSSHPEKRWLSYL